MTNPTVSPGEFNARITAAMDAADTLEPTGELSDRRDQVMAQRAALAQEYARELAEDEAEVRFESTVKRRWIIPTRRPRSREYRSAPARRSSSSRTSSADPGDPEPAPTPTGWWDPPLYVVCPECRAPLHTDKQGADHCGGCAISWWEGVR